MNVKRAYYAFALFLALTIIAGSTYSLPWGPAPDSFVAVSSDKAVWHGTLKASRFPVEWFGAAPQVGDTRRYREIDVLVLETEEDGAEAREYLLHYGGRTEMVPLGGGNLAIGGLTLDEINGAYRVQAPVEVTGVVYKLTREGGRYDMIRVEAIEIPDRSTLPLVIYHRLLEEGRYATGTGITDLDTVTPPTTFRVGREVTGVTWKDTRHVFSLLLSPGDRVRLSFSSQEPIDFKVYAPSEAYPESNSTRWGVQVYGYKTRSIDQVLEVGFRGTYRVLFEADNETFSTVEFNAVRLPHGDDLLFMERGSHSSSSGGMGSLRIFPGSIPMRIVIGRTWSMSGAWTDHSYNYTAYLEAGDTVRLQYNATNKIDLKIKLGRATLRDCSSVALDETFTFSESGSMSLIFSVDEPGTAIVSARCRLLSGSLKLNRTLTLYPYQEDAPAFPPRFNLTTVRGMLTTADFPLRITRLPPHLGETVVENTTVIAIATDEGALMYLHLGVHPELIPYPEGGYTKVGNLTLYDVVAAYEEGLRVSVEGFPFTEERNGEAYSMFHVNSIRVEEPERLPLSADHSWDIVIGRNTYCYGNDTPISFPVRFSVGFDSYEEGYGYPEHFYHVYLMEGETIRYQLNATSQIEFRAYADHPRDSQSVIPFSLGKPEQYFIQETVASADGYHTAKASGYYTFAFKAWSGVKAEVTFNCVRVASPPLS